MANFTAQTEASTKVLLHVDTTESVADVINGRPFKLPANEPVEMPVFAANAILRHIGHLHGIVEVKQVRTKTGVQWDVQGAIEQSHEYLQKCENDIVQFYVRQQMEDRVAGGKPALPPTGRALTVVLGRKINLRKKYGISPVGWSDPDSDTPYTGQEQAVSSGQETAALRATVASQNEIIAGLQAQQADLNDKFKQLMSALNGGGDEEDKEADVTDKL